MDDNDDSDSDVEISKKRKLGILEDEDSDESDDEESESDDDTDDSEDNPGDDIILTDDVTSDQCAICLMEFADQKVGVPNNCTHVFCLVCIQEWAKNINTCPVDRKVFYAIAVKKADNPVTIEEIKVEDKTQVKEEYEDPTSCEICGIGDREDRMLLCDGCDRGFHLECLTPPLDSVPHDEWFCRDCFVDTSQDNSQDNTQEDDSIDYSQHAIAFSDEEMPSFELESRPIASSAISSGASTSQRRARTVATSRRRRRRRRNQGSSQTPRRQRPRKKKTTTKSSDKGASTMTTRTSKPKRRKRKKCRKSRKKKKKIKSDENVHQNTTRYLLPREMEPTATFSLFGSDFDLEYLPEIEARTSAVTSQQSPQSRFSTTANPDVLGNIITGLNTLHSDSLSVDNKGRLIRNEENKTASLPATKSNGPRTSTQTTSTSSHKEEKPASLSVSGFTCCPREKFGRCPIHGKVHKHVHDPSTEKCNENETVSRKFVNEKRLKRFDTTASTCTFTKPVADCVSFIQNKNISPKFDTEKVAKLEHKEDNLTRSTFVFSNSSLQSSQLSLASYKIPRKTPTSESNLPTRATSKSKETLSIVSTNTESKSPIKSSTVKSPVKNSERRIARRMLKIPDSPKKVSGILHLLPAEVGKSTLKQAGIDDTSKQLKNKDPYSRFITRSTVPNTPNISNANTSQADPARKKRIIPVSKSTSSATDIYYLNEASTSRDITLRERSSNLTATSVANVNDEISLTPRSGQTALFEHSRPIAVVRPTKIDEKSSQGTSHDEEAVRRRKEGIERLRRKEMICQEVKHALRPFYKHQEISKEIYKDIYGRAVEKISKSSHPVVPSAVAKFVRKYVKNFIGRQIPPTTSDT